MEQKQTAVEWLDRWFRDNPEATHEEGNKALNHAKEMEKQQIIHALKVAFTDGIRTGSPILKSTYESPYKDWEQYYNEEYGK